MRFLALGGVAGPVVFAGVVLVCAALRPGYSHSMQVMSALGETGGPNALLMNGAGFVPTGVLLMAFALSLSQLVPRSAWAAAGAILVGLFGLSIVGAGAFSCDLGCSGIGTSREAFMHIVASVLAFTSGVAGCASWGLAFRSAPAWRSLWAFSIASAIVSGLLLLAFNAATASNSLPGVWQRLFLGSLFLWCGAVGIYAFRISAPARRAA